MRQWAEAQGMRGKAPVYSYMFAHPHSYVPGVTFSDLDPATAGAYHTSEVPFWLGTLDSFNLFRKTRAWTTADRTLSDRMTDTLVAFARTGKPDTTTVQWPVFAGRQPELVELNTNIRSTPWPTAPRTAFFVGERIAPGGPKPVRD
jgi:para-nitrobenzyl esterase